MVDESWNIQYCSYAGHYKSGEDLPRQDERNRNIRHPGISSW